MSGTEMTIAAAREAKRGGEGQQEMPPRRDIGLHGLNGFAASPPVVSQLCVVIGLMNSDLDRLGIFVPITGADGTIAEEEDEL
jgi:hypothetical protein